MFKNSKLGDLVLDKMEMNTYHLVSLTEHGYKT